MGSFRSLGDTFVLALRGRTGMIKSESTGAPFLEISLKNIQLAESFSSDR